jgi:hypothetical protein
MMMPFLNNRFTHWRYRAFGPGDTLRSGWRLAGMPGMKRREFLKTATGVGAGMVFSGGSMGSLLADEPRADLPQPDPEVKRVLVMFKCHFDAGFIDTQANVLRRYFTEYFPRAIEVARQANAGGKRRYVWTTGSWLVYEYLDQASPADRKIMEEAIGRGDIAWHALPFTWQTEMMSASMIEGSLGISKDLDKRFGKTTTGAKMTDVPGHTRGLIAPLAKHNIGFLEIGVNGGSTVAKLPPIFLWKSPSGASLPVMYHWDYGGTARIPGSDIVLATRVRDDNSGPHTAEEIARMHVALAAQFPNAGIVACNLSEMAEALAPHRQALPIVAGEIGDTWIHGVGSDPLKVARYRELARMRDAWILGGNFKVGDPTDVALLRRLLLEVEHTWGTDTKTWLDFDNYKPADLERMLDTKNYKVVEFSWQEKRQDLLDAVGALPEGLQKEARQRIDAMKPREPLFKRLSRQPAKTIESKHLLLEIDAKTGAITRLQNKSSGREWASEDNPIALLAYQTLSAKDYDTFIKSYLTTTADWAFKDFGKPNIGKFGAESRTWLPRSASVQEVEQIGGRRFIIQPRFEDEQAFQSGRASFPRKMFIDLLLSDAAPEIFLELTWFQKPPTRLPEALWLTFNPKSAGTPAWALTKSDELVSPFEVVESGNRHMHALTGTFELREGAHCFAVDAQDAPLIALGERTPLLFSNDQPDLARGIHSCLYNNAWGTNYIMWYGEDARFRYLLKA